MEHGEGGKREDGTQVGGGWTKGFSTYRLSLLLAALSLHYSQPFNIIIYLIKSFMGLMLKTGSEGFMKGKGGKRMTERWREKSFYKGKGIEVERRGLLHNKGYRSVENKVTIKEKV